MSGIVLAHLCDFSPCMCKSFKWMQAAVSWLPSKLWIPESVCLGFERVMSYRGINPLLFGTRDGSLHLRVCLSNCTPRQRVRILGRVEILVACGSGASSRAPPPAEQIYLDMHQYDRDFWPTGWTISNKMKLERNLKTHTQIDLLGLILTFLYLYFLFVFCIIFCFVV